MKNTCFWILILLTFVACTPVSSPTPHKQQLVVGVSQVGDEEWFRELDHEMQQEALFHPELKLVFRNAHYNYDLQCSQIDSFIAEKVDLLIVGPNDINKICAASNRAYDAGIPVLMTSHYGIGEKYTAFVCMSNYSIGSAMADFLIETAKEEGATPKHPLQALEIIGPTNICPTELRSNGLREGIEDRAEVQLVATCAADWHREQARQAVDSLLKDYPNIRAIVAQGDEMAIGAAMSCASVDKHVHIMGVDAVAGADRGIDAILKGTIEASVMNTGRGDIVIQTAADILAGRPYKKENYLPVILVNETSPQLMLRMSEQMNHSQDAIETLQNQVHSLGALSGWQRWVILWLCVLVIVLIIVWMIIRNVRHNQQKVREQLQQNAQLVSQQQQQLDALTEELARTIASQSTDEKFMQKLQNYIEEHLTDTTLTVEQIQRYMNVSRTQLFRKIRELFDTTPIELIRHIRLHKAQQMLQKGDLTIQEVAYSVGFSSPSYFTKCYKAEFGVIPTKGMKN